MPVSIPELTVNYAEADRFLFLETPLGKDKLLLESFTGQEGISQLFSFQLELLSPDPKIAFDAILGKKISFGVNGPTGHDKRMIHGIVSSFTQLPSNLRLARYRAEVVPQFWLFTRRLRSRIFQGKSVDEILTTVLTGLEVSFELTGQFPKRDYCVQYRETDFDFACRLMEEEGIFYFFKHAASSHKLVVANAPAAHSALPSDQISYDELAGGGRDEERISNWLKTQQIGSGKHTLWDYDYLAPNQKVKAERTVLPTAQVGKVTHKLKLPENTDLEIYDYPAGVVRYHQNALGSGNSTEIGNEAQIGMQEMDRSQFVISGDSNVHWMTPGFKFTLAQHANADGVYVLTRVVHAASEGSFYSDGDTESSLYSNTFECLPITLPYRPARETEKPHVWGCQTAVVVGASGEEIFTDKYARVKVQFHWDRDGKKDENSSCWVRVASFWAGKNWGAIHIPRIGHEVIVDFLEGDPDQPIIVGSVYNADNMPPYSLPDNKTQSGILTRSSKGGGAANFNSIRFEDKKGSEQLFIHAEKNQDIEVEKDETHWVGQDRTKTVDRNEVNHVKKDRTTTIDGNDTETVHQKQTIKVDLDQETTIGANMKVTVMASKTQTITGSKSETITGSRSATVTGSDSLTTVGGLSVTTPATVSITAAGGVTITSGAPLTIVAPMIALNAAMVTVAGVLQCTTLISSVGVVSPVYTPGVGNMI